MWNAPGFAPPIQYAITKPPELTKQPVIHERWQRDDWVKRLPEKFNFSGIQASYAREIFLLNKQTQQGKVERDYAHAIDAISV